MASHSGMESLAAQQARLICCLVELNNNKILSNYGNYNLIIMHWPHNNGYILSCHVYKGTHHHARECVPLSGNHGVD